MRTMARRNGHTRIATTAWVVSFLVGMTGLFGCGTVQFESGRAVNPNALEQSLKTGVSTRADVKRALGKPYGRGRALMPFHESERSVWTYYYERGSMDLGSGETHDQRLYVFVFLAGDKFDGYMWFASKLQ